MIWGTDTGTYGTAYGNTPTGGSTLSVWTYSFPACEIVYFDEYPETLDRLNRGMERVKRHLADWYATVSFVESLSRFVARRAKPVDALVPSVEAVRRFRPHGRSPRPWLSPRHDAPRAA
jgi:hypothetical protein